MGHANTRTKRQMKATIISAEDYVRNDVSRVNQQQVTDRFNELVDQFTELYKDEHSNKRNGNEWYDSKHVNIIQPPMCMNLKKC